MRLLPEMTHPVRTEFLVKTSFKDVAVVAIGRNEGERLANCLRTAREICPQLVYADSMSTDGSVQLAQSLGVMAIQLDDSATHTAARGRNAGFQEVRAKFPSCEFVQFVDGDCAIAPGWIETARRFLIENPRVAVVCGRRLETNPEASFYNGVIDGEWNTPVGEAAACGGDALVRVEAFERIGGFRADIIAGEEPEMCSRLRRAGWKIWRLDAPMTRHDAAIYHLSQWIRRASRSGFGYAQVWMATAGTADRMYRREIRSALTWTMLLPMFIAAGAWLIREPLVLLALPIAYVVQIVRIAVRKGLGSSFAWKYAALVMTTKFGEAWGVLNYYLSKRRERRFDYKQSQRAT